MSDLKPGEKTESWDVTEVPVLGEEEHGSRS
jgi:hypothetical protein